MAVLAGWRKLEDPLAGMSTLNRLELPDGCKRYHKIDYEAARELYEQFHCQRGAMENRIKEQICLFAYRLSAEEMKGNQLRLYLSALAYTLVEALRRLALKGTEWAEAQVDTIRLQMFTSGALVRISVRRVWLEMHSFYPWKHIYARASDALRC
jgi:hypothetical protein